MTSRDAPFPIGLPLAAIDPVTPAALRKRAFLRQNAEAVR